MSLQKSMAQREQMTYRQRNPTRHTCTHPTSSALPTPLSFERDNVFKGSLYLLPDTHRAIHHQGLDYDSTSTACQHHDSVTPSPRVVHNGDQYKKFITVDIQTQPLSAQTDWFRRELVYPPGARFFNTISLQRDPLNPA